MPQIFEIPRLPDGEGLYLHFTGGFRAAKRSVNDWRIEPILAENKPASTGPLSKSQVLSIAKQNNFNLIALQSFGFLDGVYNSSWSPIIPDQSNHSQGPAELWSQMAGNLSRSRTSDFFESAKNPSMSEVSAALDDRDPTEALAKYIGLSLRSMDLCMEGIAEHYFEQLVNNLAAGRIDGEQSANTSSQTLYANVHSFLLHLGAARDYLAALIAHRLGLSEKIDSLARLVGALGKSDFPNDSLLKILFATGNVAADPNKPAKYVVSGWMEEVTNIRNLFVHKRPYGSRLNESFGWAKPTQKEAGLYRYFRPIETNRDADEDVLDLMHHHYQCCTSLMHQAALAAGEDTSMLHITDEDVISMEIKRPDRKNS